MISLFFLFSNSIAYLSEKIFSLFEKISSLFISLSLHNLDNILFLILLLFRYILLSELFKYFSMNSALTNEFKGLFLDQ